MPRKKYDTLHRSRVVKTRMTEEEYADFAARLAPYGISPVSYTHLDVYKRQVVGMVLVPLLSGLFSV